MNNIQSDQDKVTVFTVSKETLSEFRFKAKRDNGIRTIWKDIMAVMTSDLREEVKSKRCDLIKQYEGKMEFYEFQCSEGSSKLVTHLKNFRISIEN